MDQLQMFGLPPEKQGPVRPAEVPAELAQLAARLRPNLRLGTSSWSFPGWEGIVYDRRVSNARLAKEGLAAYAAHPLFRTVGVDRASTRRSPPRPSRPTRPRSRQTSASWSRS